MIQMNPDLDCLQCENIFWDSLDFQTNCTNSTGPDFQVWGRPLDCSADVSLVFLVL